MIFLCVFCVSVANMKFDWHLKMSTNAWGVGMMLLKMAVD